MVEFSLYLVKWSFSVVPRQNSTNLETAFLGQLRRTCNRWSDQKAGDNIYCEGSKERRQYHTIISNIVTRVGYVQKIEFQLVIANSVYRSEWQYTIQISRATQKFTVSLFLSNISESRFPTPGIGSILAADPVAQGCWRACFTDNLSLGSSTTSLLTKSCKRRSEYFYWRSENLTCTPQVNL